MLTFLDVTLRNYPIHYNNFLEKNKGFFSKNTLFFLILIFGDKLNEFSA